MPDLATLQQRLDEVDDAIHRLMTGGREVQVRAGAVWATYSEVDLPQLKTYRADLARRIAALTGTGRRLPILVDP